MKQRSRLGITTKTVSFILFTLAAMSYAINAKGETITVGYQLMENPLKVIIAEHKLETATGDTIKWKRFKSGSSVISAMASGAVQVAVAGGPPSVVGMTQGLPINLFWILESSHNGEALVVREGSGIKGPQDLKGERIAVPFASTSHFRLLYALRQVGLKPNSDVRLLNMQPGEIAAAWQRGDINAAFVWDPALGQIEKTGRALIPGGLLDVWGRPTFDAMVARKDFESGHKVFLCTLVKELDGLYKNYRQHPNNWSKNSGYAKDIAQVSGGAVDNVPHVLKSFKFIEAKEQASSKWLGGSKDSDVSKNLLATAQFLKRQGVISSPKASYVSNVTAGYAKMAAQGQCGNEK